MQHLRTPIRVVLYQQAGVWIAHCLEFDLLGDGPTREAALEMLSQAIQIQVEATLDFNNPANLFSPADGKYFTMFAASDDASADLSLQFEPMTGVRIDHVELREFAGTEAVAV